MRVFIGILGFVLGGVAGIWALLVNPLVEFDLPGPLDDEQATRSRFAEPAARGMDLRLATMLGLREPDLAAGFSSPALRLARVGITVLSGGPGQTPALAVKLSAFAEHGDLLRGRLGMRSSWNIVWPGQGGLFLVGQDNHWPMLSDAARSLLRGDGFVVTEDEYQLTSRWESTDYQGAIGASGRFAEAAGQFREFAAPRERRPLDADGALALLLRLE